MVGLPVGALAVWLFDPWAERGEMPVALPVIALVVLLVNLLAAGAASFPGVFNSAWVLLPIALIVGQRAYEITSRAINAADEMLRVTNGIVQ